MRAAVILVSDAPDEMVRDMHMLPARSLEEALAMADGLLEKKGITQAKILAIPDGVSVIIQ